MPYDLSSTLFALFDLLTYTLSISVKETLQLGEKDLEDCLVLKFSKLQTILVWAHFKGGHKGPLIFWNKEN